MSLDPRVRPVAPIGTRPLFDIVVDLNPRLDIGAGRVLFGAAGGTFHGDRLSGDVLPGGGDWAVFRPDGTMVLDVRLTLRTDDGDLVHMTYGGRWVRPAAVRAELTDPATRLRVDPARYYFRTAVLFETGADRLQWLNDVVCVGSGYLVERGIAYCVSEIL